VATTASHNGNLLSELDGLFIADGGLETTLIFHQGLELPDFAAFVLLDDDRDALRAYYEPYIALARDRAVGLILDTPTWRASPDWGERLGYSAAALAAANRTGVELLDQLRAESGVSLLISGCVGPRGDGYRAEDLMGTAEAERYHAAQVAAFAEAGADLVTALTMTYAEEAIGIVRAACATGLPVVVSFTVETDGRLPSRQTLEAAIAQVDVETDSAAAYFMVNCAHPTHFAGVLEPGAAWVDRIGGVRANASRLSHAELDEAEELDEGDRIELAQHYRELRPTLRRAAVVGGCCGTDSRHIAEICAAWLAD